MSTDEKNSNKNEAKTNPPISGSYSELLEISKKKEKIVYNQLKKNINPEENEEIIKEIKKLIKNDDESIYNKYFNITKFNISYNALILKLLKFVLDSQKDSKSFISEKFINSKVCKEYINNFHKNNFYYDKSHNLFEIAGKNIFILNLVGIYRILLNDKKINKNESLYKEILIKVYDCFYFLIEESVTINQHIEKSKKDKINSSDISNLMKEISHIYLQIFREINEIISGDERLVRIIMKKLSEKEKKIKIIFFDGMIKNCFCNVAESISNLLIKIFNSFKGSNIKDNMEIENLHNFYFLLMEIIFNDLPYDVEEKIEEISKDNYEDSYFESNYEKNIEYFFNTIQSLLNYLYIFKYDKNKFKKFIEYINKKVIPFIYETNIKNNKIIQSLYEILYGGLCGLYGACLQPALKEI